MNEQWDRVLTTQTDTVWLKRQFDRLEGRFDKLDERVDSLALASAVNKTKLSVIVGGIAAGVSGVISVIVRMVS